MEQTNSDSENITKGIKNKEEEGEKEKEKVKENIENKEEQSTKTTKEEKNIENGIEIIKENEKEKDKNKANEEQLELNKENDKVPLNKSDIKEDNKDNIKDQEKKDKNTNDETKEKNKIKDETKESTNEEKDLNENFKINENKDINNKLNKNEDNTDGNFEINTFSINSFLNESNNKKKGEGNNKIKDEKNNTNKLNFDKRKSLPTNNKDLKHSSLTLSDKNLEKNINNDNDNDDFPPRRKRYQPIKRSYSEAIIQTKKTSEKKNFYNELSNDPKYQRLIDLKEETENALRKTVGNKGSSNFLKSLVSQKKARFCYDGFDLDLTYITMKIIAMGLPSTSFEGLYRNNMEDVKRFFNVRHPQHHKIYNLCEEKKYPKDCFYRQGYYPFPDHEAPPLNSLMPFCEDAKQFLDEDDKNVVAVHCKAGKGRTGTFICCLLLYLGIFDSADESMKYYGLMRVGAEKGVTVPSQKRYVHYFEQILKKKLSTPLKYKTICIKELKIYTIPCFSKFGASCTPTFTIQNGKKIFKYSDINKKKTTYNNTSYKNIVFPLTITGFSVTGDVLITFYHLQFFGKDKMFKFWFNTQFLSEKGVLVIEKNCLDKAFKDKENKFFDPNFKVEMKYFFV